MTDKGMGRREFLRTSVISAVSSSALGSAINGWTFGDVDASPGKWVSTVCRFCGTGCGVEAGVTEGRITAVRGDVAAWNEGLLCIKGHLQFRMMRAKTRALHPMIRKDGKLVQASWNGALDLVAAKFREAIANHGPDAVGFYGSGQLYTEESYCANKLFKAGIGTNNVDGNPRLCMASAVGGYVSSFGKDEPPGCYEDLDHANCFFLIGANMAECHPVLMRRINNRKEQAPDKVTIIVADPRKTITARQADLHLPFLPGTDLALVNAMAQTLVAEGFADEAFLRRHVNFHRTTKDRVSFADYRKFLQDYTPEKVAPLCGVSADLIRRAARAFGRAKEAVSCWTMGLNQRVRGVWVNNLVTNLHLLTGKIGRPGSTPLSLTGQPNACGGVRDTGTLSHALPAGHVVAKAGHRAKWERLWNVPAGRISPKPGYHTVEMFRALGDGRLKALLIMCTNPGQSLPNLTPNRKAIAGDSFVVVADAFFPTRTAELADVILPAACWVEKEGCTGNSERRYRNLPKLIEPPGEAKSDLWILLQLAERLGHGELLPYRTPEEVWDEWRTVAKDTPYAFSGITYPRMRKERGLQWPCPDESHPGTKRRYVKGVDPNVPADTPGRMCFYGKPDGRATVWLRPQEGPAEPVDDDYPFYLTTGRVLEHWHTGTMTSTIPRLRRAYPHAFAEIHPTDATKLNVRDGQKVKLTSRRGSVLVEARIVDTPRPGMIFVPFFDPEALINLVTIDAFDPGSKQPEFKICAVKVERV